MDRRTFVFSAPLATRLGAAEEPPREWVEPATGHRVIRLSNEPGSASLYFHQNPFTARGDKMIFTLRGRLAVLDWRSRDIRVLTERPARGLVAGRKSRQAFFHDGETVCACNLDTGAVRTIAKVPREYAGGSGLTVNADETLLAGTSVEPGTPRPAPARSVEPSKPDPNAGAQGNPNPSQDVSLEAVWRQRTPRQIYTLNIKTGEVKVILRGKDWYNHIQFSPRDPGLLMFCHEGPWHFVDRIWNIRTDGSGLRLIHKRTMEMEIAGHEFWSPDGKTVWYDLQTPKSKVFWLAGMELATNRLTKYSVAREHWSVHFNISWDGKLFAGDGGGPRSVAAPGNGQWIYLFTPKGGTLKVEKLVDLAKHDYRLEPNVIFTPDRKWIVFRSNLHGASHVYAVEDRRAT